MTSLAPLLRPARSSLWRRTSSVRKESMLAWPRNFRSCEHELMLNHGARPGLMMWETSTCARPDEFGTTRLTAHAPSPRARTIPLYASLAGTVPTVSLMCHRYRPNSQRLHPREAHDLNCATKQTEFCKEAEVFCFLHLTFPPV